MLFYALETRRGRAKLRGGHAHDNAQGVKKRSSWSARSKTKHENGEEGEKSKH